MSTGTGQGTLLATESFIPLSAVAICNMALGHIGARPIASIDEESQEARNCKIFWDNTREEVLRGYRWNFAEGSVVGASLTVPEVYEDIWDYAYAIPSDALLIRAVKEDGSAKDQDYKLVSETQASGEPRVVILTNVEEAVIYYTANITLTTLWDASFVNAMAYAMAAKLAVPITKNPQIAGFMEKKAQEAMPTAKRDDFKENKISEDEVDSWESARFGG